ncbi:Gfo/Idh/MocA family protein [Flavihumibacter fluvii]|uniref:Gfo/Idh/MocA family protein n=1 Tax=Flavihumibacter fluvii TaxID=2838157 RepID=UPI001BDEDDA5|nr:Gfo/Idh/MocA family oxidoreductase [Flavihumibacter fluvii]ULQ53838.1 Gfo/Idh/MocA family oxidoreductase [Flavihumibacter fluvii]
MRNRFVIIGCGRIAHRHISEVNRIGKLVGVCDPDQVKLAAFTQQYAVPGFTGVQEMLDNCPAEVAVICSPNYLHIQHIKDVLEHRLDALCEKPLCIFSDEAAGLEQLMASAGKRVFLVLSARFHPVIQWLRQQIQQGNLGRILSFQLNACWNRTPLYYEQSNWKGKELEDGGILYTQFSHYLDALLWCLGTLRPLAVKRTNTLHHLTIEGEDTGVALLQTGGDAVGTFHWTVNSTTKNMEISLLVIAEKGTLKIGGQYMDKLEYEVVLNTGTTNTLLDEKTLVASGSHHDLIYDQLALAMDHQPHQLPGITEGLAAVQLIEAIYSLPQDPILRT